ncbi:MAG TPA: hypothetical protein DDY04_01945 [Bacteroidales bacterium]|nr:hypothetical protein [Bacteroidales bacterium]
MKNGGAYKNYINVKEKKESKRCFVNIIPELQNIDIRVEFIQAFTPMRLFDAQMALEVEVTRLTGKKSERFRLLPLGETGLTLPENIL